MIFGFLLLAFVDMASMACGCEYGCEIMVLLLVSMVSAMMMLLSVFYVFGPIHSDVGMVYAAPATYACCLGLITLFLFLICLMLKLKIIDRKSVV